jgi:hypothetical protein
MRDMPSGIVVWPVRRLFSVLSMPAFAYIGPGVGAGTVASALGVLGSIQLGLFSAMYYPIKRVIRRRGRGRGASGDSGTAD